MENLKALLLKELRLEFRNRSVISGLMLFMFSIVFICYLTFALRENLITPLVWSALYWITILFTAVNSVAKSFMGERKGRDIYAYMLTSPAAIVTSKIIYNFLLCTILSLLGFVLFALFLNNPFQNFALFIPLIFLTSWGFSSSLTLLSGIATKAGNSHILMAVLSFPVVISILLMAVRVTKNILDQLEVAQSGEEFLSLVAINCLVSAVSFLLFPYLWRS